MRLPGPLTTKAFSSLPSSTIVEVGGAGGSSLLDSLTAQDAALRNLHLSEWPSKTPARFIQPHTATVRPPATSATVATVDVAVCGGTLGLLLACALQLKGHRVAVIEAGPLRGRAQDWNTSEEELRQLAAVGVLDASELAEVAPLSFGPMACRFGPPREDRFELQLRGVLDVGVSPAALLARVRARFERAGGLVLERTPVRGVAVFADGVELSLRRTPPSPDSDGATNDETLHARLVLDCMGHRSPIALQQRAGQTPDGVCVQVGSCARGAWPESARQGAGDFFVTADDAVARGPNRRARVQYFWQAFPSSGGADERSSYLFTYLRPGPEMPSLLEVMEDYWRAMPSYQQLGRAGGGDDDEAEEAAEEAAAAALESLDVRRIVFGWFPTYRRNAPLAPSFDRVLSVGDASAVQSPISFGGFCAMLRHLPRYSRGIDLALRSDRLTAADLRLMTPYLPNLATAWMSSAAMTARALPAAHAAAAPANDDVDGDGDGKGYGGGKGGDAPYTLVNDLLSGNFEVMAGLPRPEAILFFRDVTTLSTLVAVLVGQTATMAPLLPRVVAELVGPLELVEFGGHLTLLAAYTALHRLATLAPVRDALTRAAATAYDDDDDDEPDGNGNGNAYALSCALDALAFGSGLDGEPSPSAPPPPPSSPARAADAADAADAAVQQRQQRQRAQGDDGDSRPWWRRPPPTWPPRIDDPALVVGDVFAAYFAAYASVGVLAAGREGAWQQEGAVLATSWIVAAAVTNGWDPTSVIPSLGLPNALRCVARMGIDAASTRVLLGLTGAVLARQLVDVKLLGLELALSAAALASWRCLYTLNNPDRR